ncbi:acyl-CoA dehydrogenase family protein [Hydrogenophaga sp.]|uniref:acyl-CoA dehydrogenase family protein n=1 Tax=Hydrogenophaga sp. TaxID=1904254 RepID=UPI001ED0BB60|nr:acyl-CoA dehydrogenase family protein [Hydrogenophaga sp.]MBA4215307.1 acyl-CoA dehydrogenase [Polaromonas sp.]MDP3108149.1 acyl-CoA dehydrogenase family protein [Hydrogenophaga sp.]MDZ4101494.1 acyl-CoA dehydrogenase family protein [Hydrogenophaga sp.]
MRPVFREDHEQFRDQARRFIEREIVPHLHAWEAEGIVPKSIWIKAGDAGLLCSTVPEEYGGAGGDFGHSAVMIEELARVNATAVGFTTHSEIVAPYIVAYGTEAQKQRWLPKMVSGEMVGVIAMSEPGVGSDLRSMRTTAVRNADSYTINGQKTFITNGGNADLAVTATKLDPAAKELTLICVETDQSGFSKGRRLEKIGLKGQDTSELFFDNVSVPLENRLGEEGQGFKYLTHQLAWERTIIGIRAAASIESLLDQTIQYTRDRKVFGKTVFDFQNTKFKLAECKAQATMLRVFVDDCLAKAMRGELSAEVGAMCKLMGSEMQGKILDELLQLHGGYGFMSEYMISRAWVDARVARIYGGTSEIMKEIISRSL